jgi:hypothetical protein
MFSDFRQKKYTVDSQKAFFKKYVKFKDCYDIWWQPKPLESLILLNLTSPIAFYTKTTTPSNYLHLSLKNQDHYWFYIYLRMNSTRLYTPLDLSYVTNTETLITVSSCILSVKISNLLVVFIEALHELREKQGSYLIYH